jgi:GTP 3',8-cyclase
MTSLVDAFGRTIEYVRLSVTEHCNYQCGYCMPEKLTHPCAEHFLSTVEIARLIGLFSDMGVTKVRLTGGEPLIRKDIIHLSEQLGKLPELTDLSLSTNAHLLSRMAKPLQEAGVSRVNISLDSLKAERFEKITGNGCLDKVLSGISAALDAGMYPVKLNMVVMRGVNDDEIEDMLAFAIEKGVQLRFIETMPIGHAGLQAMSQYYPVSKILERVKAYVGRDLLPVTGGRGAGPARHYQIASGPVKIGVISAVSRHFCESCNRVRLTAKGDLVLCLGQEDKVSLLPILRAGASDDDIKYAIRTAINQKPERHYFNEKPEHIASRQMVTLGG